MPTLSDIAQQANVSKSTVSLVLNNKQGITEETRARVLEARDELIAQEQSQAVQHALQKRIAQPTELPVNPLTVLGLHASVLNSSTYFGGLLKGVREGTKRYNLQLNLVAYEPDLPKTHISSLYFGDDTMLHPDGVVVFSHTYHQDIIERTRSLGIPCVFMGAPVFDPLVNNVAPDEFHAMTLAVSYLVKLGHHKIAFISGDGKEPAPQMRLMGYQQALQESGIKPQSDWEFLEEGTPVAAIEHFLSVKPDVTAVIFENEYAAELGLPRLVDHGYDIPKDLSVIVIDEVAEDSFLKLNLPPLTCVALPLQQVGLWSIKSLVDILLEPTIHTIRLSFGCQLIVRQSCVAAKASKSTVS